MNKGGFTKNCLYALALFYGITGEPAFAQSLPSDKTITDKTIEDEAKESVRKSDEKNYISVSIENDLIGGGTDQYYTSGLRLSYFNVNTDYPPVFDTIADAIPTFDLNETTSTYFTIGQNIYTPDDITIAAPQSDDRPWAGFLYGSVGLLTLEDNHVDELEFTLGVVGPESLAENTQKFVHKHLSDSPKPRGWDNQLGFEPGLILSAQRRWPRVIDADIGDYYLRAEPNINASIGNIYTYAGAGLGFSFGPDDDIIEDRPPRVRPAMPGSGYFDTPDRNWSWSIFAGVDGRAVARNIFLDGNTFKDSPSVDKKPLVADFTAGLTTTLDRYRIAYSINKRTEEFDGQNGDSVFGSVTFSTRF